MPVALVPATESKGGGMPQFANRIFKLGAGGLATLALVAVGVSLGGCSNGRSGKAPPVAQQDLLPRPALYPALHGTIKSFAAVASANPVLVRGYGIVAGLPNTGSGEMPPPIRSMMINRLLKNNIGFLSHGTAQYDPSKILRSRQIAAVFVEGVIPPLAMRGTTFDLKVIALPNTQTTSLANGLLWTTPLRVHASLNNLSRVIARGRGPVFCDPLRDSASQLVKAGTILRTGRVMAGGIVSIKIPVILELYTPSYRISYLIQQIINQRYGGNPPVAAAENDRIVQLRVPRRYQNNPAQFVDMVMHLYLEQNIPGFTQAQAKRLLKALADPTAPLNQISTALAQLGRTVLPEIEPYYNSPDLRVAFYAARAGTIIGDEDAVTVLKKIVRQGRGPYLMDAVQTLEQSHDAVRASLAFQHLLHSADPRTRLLGYKALLEIHSPAIYSQVVGEKFMLDILPSAGPTLIYATRTGYPRLAIIGRVPKLIPGSLYVSQSNAITVNYPLPSVPQKPQAISAEKKHGSAALPVQLYYRDPLSHQMVQMSCDPELPDVITALAQAPNPFSPTYNPRVPYIAASYQRIVAMLFTLCHNKNIIATFMMQRKAPPSMALYASLNQPRPSGHTLGVYRHASGWNATSTTQPSHGLSPFSSALPGEKPGN